MPGWARLERSPSNLPERTEGLHWGVWGVLQQGTELDKGVQNLPNLPGVITEVEAGPALCGGTPVQPSLMLR